MKKHLANKIEWYLLAIGTFGFTATVSGLVFLDAIGMLFAA